MEYFIQIINKITQKKIPAWLLNIARPFIIIINRARNSKSLSEAIKINIYTKDEMMVSCTQLKLILHSFHFACMTYLSYWLLRHILNIIRNNARYTNIVIEYLLACFHCIV